jgi:hypothetical protein
MVHEFAANHCGFFGIPCTMQALSFKQLAIVSSDPFAFNLLATTAQIEFVF